MRTEKIIFFGVGFKYIIVSLCFKRSLVHPAGIEPATFPFGGERSNPLSYGCRLVEFVLICAMPRTLRRAMHSTWC